MKAIFSLQENQKKEIFDRIAIKYNAALKQDDNNKLFIMAKTKLLIAEKNAENVLYVYVWGATKDDISILSQIIGEPLRIIEEKLSPEEFADELISLPEIEKKSKKMVLELLQISEKDFKRYKGLIALLAKRKKEKKFIQAYEILKKLN